MYVPRLVETYLASVPGGLDAYPDHLVKASVVDAWIAGHDREHIAASLPAAVRDRSLSRHVSEWIPEVHATAVYLAVRALFFPSDDAYVDAAYGKNRALFERPIYRAALRLLTRARIAKSVAALFGLWHRGLEASATDDEPGTIMVRLGYPENLVPKLIARCYVTAIQAALQRRGEQPPEVELQVFEPTRALLAVAWKRAVMPRASSE